MKSVVLCGSARRFKNKILALAKELKEHGVVVYAPFLYIPPAEENLTEIQQRFKHQALTFQHLLLIRKADVIYIYNEGGYIGSSVTLEIGIALGLDKPIYAYSSDCDPYVAVCFDEIITSVEDLLLKLV